MNYVNISNMVQVVVLLFGGILKSNFSNFYSRNSQKSLGIYSEKPSHFHGSIDDTIDQRKVCSAKFCEGTAIIQKNEYL